MSSYYETEAIILGSLPLAEADKIVTFLTPYYGILRGVARGSRNPKSRFSGALELLSNVEITFSHKERELVRIDRIELKKSYFHLVSDPSLLPSFAFMAETLTSLVPQGVREEKIYRMVKACILASETNPDRINLVTLYFSIWILKLSGYLPSWDFCKNCKKNLIDGSLFVIQEFNAVCISCYKNSKISNFTINASVGTKAFDKKHLQVLHLALNLTPQAFVEAMKTNSSNRPEELSEVIKRLLQSVKQV